LAEHTGRPKYLELAEALRKAIAAGQYPVGTELPSTSRLTESFGVSTTVVRGAMRELRGEGLVVGQPGKAVYVRATPATATGTTSAGVEDQLRELSKYVRGALSEIDARLTALERTRPTSPDG
jgi:DNA-binding FadR family transcriptional regulator